MHRLTLLLLLTLLLPLQLTWAAMAPYCQTENAPATTTAHPHFGHHDHQVATTKSTAPSPDHAPQAPAAFDIECSLCHLSCCESLFSSLAIPSSRHPALTTYPALPSRFTSHIPAAPDKPDWRPAA